MEDQMKETDTQKGNASSKPHTATPFADPDFQHAVQLVIRNSKNIASIYRQSPRELPTNQLIEAEIMEQFPIPKERLIGFVGVSGSGKSSLICSLLEQEGIAIVDGSGSAVTCFPVHYRSRMPQQTAKYSIRCAFPEPKKIEERLRILLDELHAPLDDCEEYTAAEYEAVQQRFRTAVATVEALFGQMADFSPCRLHDGADEVERASAWNHLLDLSSRLPWPDHTKDGMWVSEADAIEVLQESLTMFRNNGLWPLIESLTIHLEAPLLTYGVVLVDLPGYHDTNLARVKVARETQSKCDDLFVIANITRAADNPILQSVVEENAIRPDLGYLNTQTITAVCTHSAVTDKSLERHANPTALKAVKMKLGKLEAEDASARKVRRAECELKALIIQWRNKKVIAEMESRYSSKLEKGRFNVFCVDSEWFMQVGTDPEPSGIPLLQSYVADLPAKTLFRLYDHFLGARHDAMLASFENWVLASRPRPGGIAHVLPQPDLAVTFDAELKAFCEGAIQAFQKSVVRPIEQAQKSLEQDTMKVARSWRTIHHLSLRALFRREGVVNPHSLNHRDLNYEITQCMNNDNARQGDSWILLDSQLFATLNLAEAKMRDRMSQYYVTCEELDAPEPFLRSLRARQETMVNTLGWARGRFRTGAGKVKGKARVRQAESYTRECVQPAYKEAARQRGTGATKRGLQVIETHLQGPGFVTEYCQRISTDFNNHTRQTMWEMVVEAQSIARAIEADVDNLQGKRTEMALFRVDPQLGRMAERALLVAKEVAVEIERLVSPARERAVQVYGREFLPCR